MSDKSKEMHSLIFKSGNVTKNTWDDWHLIPSSRFSINQPSPVYKYVDVPGRDGPLDVTDYLIGRPVLSDRKGSFEFMVPNGFQNWTALREELAAFFMGGKMQLTLEDDPDYYYVGRFFFKGWTPGATFSSVSIDYEIETYRYSKTTNEEAGL